MRNPVYWISERGSEDWAAVQSAGFAGVSLNLRTDDDWAQLAGNLEALDAAGLGLFFVDIEQDIAADPDGRLIDVMQSLAGRGALVVLSLTSSGAHDRASSSRADGRAAAWLLPVLKAAGAQGVRVALRPEAGAWVARIEDAVRLGMRINRSNLGVVFDLPVWRAVDGTALEDRLHLALPRMWDLRVGEVAAAVDEVTAVLALGRKLGYAGPVGVGGPGPAAAAEAWGRLG